ncbi:MAG: hypothetical protein V1738_01135 [Patescibacteria group bacterium]
MPKGVAIAVGVGVVAVIGSVLIFFDSPTGPDSGEEIEIVSPDSGEEVDLGDEPNGPDSGEEVDLGDDFMNRAKGSCNAIGFGSTCVEYLGSYWTDNTMKLNCAYAYSRQPCPRPTIGGCSFGAGTPTEIVTWHYDYGGDPFTAEVRPYTAGACNGVPGAHWVQ